MGSSLTTSLDKGSPPLGTIEKQPQVSADLIRASYRSDDFPADWSDAERAEACRRYRNWLGLKMRYPHQRLAPTRDIDLFWHLHMLSPVAYHKDCLANFGRLLDHDGGYGKGSGEAEKLREVFLATGRLYEATYGEPYGERGETIEQISVRNCWHDCQNRCWHACSDDSFSDNVSHARNC